MIYKARTKGIRSNINSPKNGNKKDDLSWRAEGTVFEYNNKSPTNDIFFGDGQPTADTKRKKFENNDFNVDDPNTKQGILRIHFREKIRITDLKSELIKDMGTWLNRCMKIQEDIVAEFYRKQNDPQYVNGEKIVRQSLERVKF